MFGVLVERIYEYFKNGEFSMNVSKRTLHLLNNIHTNSGCMHAYMHTCTYVRACVCARARVCRWMSYLLIEGQKQRLECVCALLKKYNEYCKRFNR